MLAECVFGAKGQLVGERCRQILLNSLDADRAPPMGRPFGPKVTFAAGLEG